MIIGSPSSYCCIDVYQSVSALRKLLGSVVHSSSCWGQFCHLLALWSGTGPSWKHCSTDTDLSTCPPYTKYCPLSFTYGTHPPSPYPHIFWNGVVSCLQLREICVRYNSLYMLILYEFTGKVFNKKERDMENWTFQGIQFLFCWFLSHPSFNIYSKTRILHESWISNLLCQLFGVVTRN